MRTAARHQPATNGSRADSGSHAWRMLLAASLLLGASASPLIADPLRYIEGKGIHLAGSDIAPFDDAVLFENHDGSTEAAFTWSESGVEEPESGALAEGFADLRGAASVCGVRLYLTRWGDMTGDGLIDLFVWEPNTYFDQPGLVLSISTSVRVSGVRLWPSVTTHDLDVADAGYYIGGVYVGYWPRSFVGGPPGFACAIDQNGPAGRPRTYIAPGLGYPSGWAHPSILGHRVESLGIAAWCGYARVPTDETSWGQVKATFRERANAANER